MFRKTPYTPEEDTMLLAAKLKDLVTLAKKFGRSLIAVQHRRRVLLNPELRSGRPKHYIKKSKPLTITPFARPAWFDEDLETISRSKR